MPPNRSTRLLRDGGGIGGLAEVARHVQRAIVRGPVAVDEPVDAAVGEHDVGAAVGERAHDGAPEIAGGAGHDDSLLAEVHRFPPLQALRQAVV